MSQVLKGSSEHDETKNELARSAFQFETSLARSRSTEQQKQQEEIVTRRPSAICDRPEQPAAAAAAAASVSTGMYLSAAAASASTAGRPPVPLVRNNAAAFSELLARQQAIDSSRWRLSQVNSTSLPAAAAAIVNPPLPSITFSSLYEDQQQQQLLMSAAPALLSNIYAGRARTFLISPVSQQRSSITTTNPHLSSSLLSPAAQRAHPATAMQSRLPPTLTPNIYDQLMIPAATVLRRLQTPPLVHLPATRPAIASDYDRAYSLMLGVSSNRTITSPISNSVVRNPATTPIYSNRFSSLKHQNNNVALLTDSLSQQQQQQQLSANHGNDSYPLASLGVDTSASSSTGRPSGDAVINALLAFHGNTSDGTTTIQTAASAVAMPRYARTNTGSDSFPVVLHRALAAQDKCSSSDTCIATFLPDGSAFHIHNQFLFETRVLPVFFPRMKGFASFQRQLNLYDFKRIGGSGADRGAYRHALFVRNFPERAIAMKRTKLKGGPPRRDRPRRNRGIVAVVVPPAAAGGNGASIQLLGDSKNDDT